jgi:carboxymethylenebutenolidase
MSGYIKLNGINGYLVRPSAIDRWPAVIVVHEWWGLDNQTESVTDRLGRDGYLAFAPDLFNGELAKPGDTQKAAALVQKYDQRAPEDLQNAFHALKSHPDCTGKVGAVGFSFGGSLALTFAASQPLDAVCTFYGGMMQPASGRLGEIKSPVLGLFGENDQCNPVDRVKKLAQQLDEAGVEHEVIVYPNSGHAFFRERDPDNYRSDAASDAWERLREFFEKHLN